MPSVGPNQATTGDETVTAAADWLVNTNPTSPIATDAVGNLVRVSLDNTTGPSEYLIWGGFGFTLVEHATILGVYVELKLDSESAFDPSTIDIHAQALKSGAPVGSDLALGQTITINGGGVYQLAYGGSTALLGTTWTADEINSQLGFQFQCESNADPLVGDQIAASACRITVYYVDPVAADFTCHQESNTVVECGTHCNVTFTCDQDNDAFVTCVAVGLVEFICDQDNDAIIECSAHCNVGLTCDQHNNCVVTHGAHCNVAFTCNQTNDAIISCGAHCNVTFTCHQETNAICAAGVTTLVPPPDGTWELESQLTTWVLDEHIRVQDIEPQSTQWDASMVQELRKDPLESLEYSFDFHKRLVEGETITHQSHLSSPSGLSISGDSHSTDGLSTVLRISSGAESVRYKVTASAQTNQGNIRIGHGILVVDDA